MVDGYQLGAWVVTQRVRHADEGTLDADRERRLQELPGWIWDARVDNWEEGFSRLQDYVERHGDARVPQPYTVDGYPLGVCGSVRNASSTAKAPLRLTANADSRG